jgi:hypothetical protein
MKRKKHQRTKEAKTPSEEKTFEHRHLSHLFTSGRLLFPPRALKLFLLLALAILECLLNKKDVSPYTSMSFNREKKFFSL